MSSLQNSNAVTPASGFELKSVRLDYDSDPRLQYPLVADPTSKKVGTFSWWAKYSLININQCMFCGFDSNATMDYIGPRADNGFDFYGQAGGYMNYQIHIAPATRVFRDVAAWYHFVWEIDILLGDRYMFLGDIFSGKLLEILMKIILIQMKIMSIEFFYRDVRVS